MAVITPGSTPTDKEWEALLKAYADLPPSSSGSPSHFTFTPQTPPQGPLAGPQIGQRQAPPPSRWSFLQTMNERYLNIFSIFSSQLASHEWLNKAPGFLPSFLNDKFFQVTSPLAGSAAALVTQMFIRTFNYDRHLERNPVSFGENLNRTVKSMAHSAVMMATMTKVFSTAGAWGPSVGAAIASPFYYAGSLAASAGSFAASFIPSSIAALTPSWLATAASSLTAAISTTSSYAVWGSTFALGHVIPFVVAGAFMFALHMAIDKVGVYKAFSDLMDSITGTTIQPPTEEERKLDSTALQMTQQALMIFMMLRQSGTI